MDGWNIWIDEWMDGEIDNLDRWMATGYMYTCSPDSLKLGFRL